MNNRNIAYKSQEIENYYSNNRISWGQFYPSERNVFESCGLHPGISVLDIGCGCGGLGIALNERFSITDYTGIDISEQAIVTGKKMNSGACLIAGDILSNKSENLNTKQFDMVVSLSCVDWNVEFGNMLKVAWNYVKPGGWLVSSFRLTDLDGVDLDRVLEQSYQYINFSGSKRGEKAAYVVMNAQELMNKLYAFNPGYITAYGYWGNPSLSAVTPYRKICFSAFQIKKRVTSDICPIQLDLHLPDEIQAIMVPLTE